MIPRRRFAKPCQSGIRTVLLLALGCLGCGESGQRGVEAPSPIVLAHRGLEELGPENSIPAVLAGVRYGADGAEIDVRLLKSGEVVVLHDDTVDRVTTGSGRVADLTLVELKSFLLKPDAGGRHPRETVPTLEELFVGVGPEAVLLVEMKRPQGTVDAGDGLEQKVGALIDAHDRYHSTYVSSFNPTALRLIQDAYPQVRTILEYHQGIAHGLPRPDDLAAAGSVHAIGPRVDQLTPELVDWAKKNGYQVSTFSPLTLDEMETVAALGVDIVQTHRPKLFRMVLAGALGPEALARIPPGVVLDFDREPESSYRVTPVSSGEGLSITFAARPEALYLLQFNLRFDPDQSGENAAGHIFVIEGRSESSVVPVFGRVNARQLSEQWKGARVHTGPALSISEGTPDASRWRPVRLAFFTQFGTRSLRLLVGATEFQGRLILADFSLRILSVDH